MERLARVKLAYDVVNQAIEAFRLIPQVYTSPFALIATVCYFSFSFLNISKANASAWPLPVQLRGIGGNTKDAIAFLSIGAKVAPPSVYLLYFCFLLITLVRTKM